MYSTNRLVGSRATEVSASVREGSLEGSIPKARVKRNEVERELEEKQTSNKVSFENHVITFFVKMGSKQLEHVLFGTPLKRN